MQPMAIEAGRADAELLGAEHGGDDDVTAGADAAVRRAAGREWRRLLSVRTWLASDRPISHGEPAYLIEVCGLAPVPPTLPEIRMVSALAFATPAAMAPMPVIETSFTVTPAHRD